MKDWQFGLATGGVAGALYLVGFAIGYGSLRIHRLVTGSRVWRFGIRTREDTHV